MRIFFSFTISVNVSCESANMMRTDECFQTIEKNQCTYVWLRKAESISRIMIEMVKLTGTA